MSDQPQLSAAPLQPPLPWWKHGRVYKAFVGFLVASVLLTGAWWQWLRPFVHTDDARIAAPVEGVAPQGLAGRIARVWVAEGQTVAPGTVVVSLDDQSEQGALARTQANFKLAEAKVREAQAQLDLEIQLSDIATQTAQAVLDSAQANYQMAVAGPRHEELARAEANLRAAESKNHQATDDLKRATTLVDSGAAPRAQSEIARSNALAAQAAVDSARATVQQVHAGTRPEELRMAQGSVHQAQSRLAEAAASAGRVVLRREQLTEAQAGLAQASADQALAQLAVDRTQVRSQLGGVVLRLHVDPGDHVSPGQTVVTIADLHSAWVAANVEETAIADLRKGQLVRIEVDEGGELSGHVDVIAQSSAGQFALIPADNASGNYTKVVQRIPIRIAIDSKEKAKLRVGQSVVVQIRVR